MPIQAQSADGTIHEFPDGTADAIVDKAMKAYAAPASPDPSQSSIMQRLATSMPVRAARGMMDPIMGGIQAIAHGVAQLPGADQSVVPQIDQGLARGEQMYQADRAATGQSGLDLPRIAGNVASPINFALPEIAPLRAAGLVGRVANGAVTGAGLGGLQPVFDPNNYAAEKTNQVELGAAGGALVPTIGGIAKGIGKLTPHILGGTTGTGANAVKGAYEAGKAGGDAAAAFTDSMRGNTPWDDVVSQAKDALGNMRAERNAAYRSGMADISKDATVLDFTPVDAALAKTNGVKNFKGVDTSPKTADVRAEIDKAISDWKGLDPAEYHTPEGFDALKQMLGDIRDDLPFHSPQRVIADNAYSAVRKTIADQAPAYNKVMSGYSKASEEVSNIQRELSLGPKGNPATALKKLQSVMRNNVNTNWGARADMAGKLADNGAPNLLPALAGQSMNAVLPRGLARVMDAGLVGAGAFASPGALAALPLASPRAVGELAYGAGNVARGATALGNLPILRRLPRLPVGAFGAGLPNLINPAVNGAQ